VLPPVELPRSAHTGPSDWSRDLYRCTVKSDTSTRRRSPVCTINNTIVDSRLRPRVVLAPRESAWLYATESDPCCCSVNGLASSRIAAGPLRIRLSISTVGKGRSKWRNLIKDVRWSGWVWVGECFFWYWPTWVVPDQRPLNGCVCVCVCVRACVYYQQISNCCRPVLTYRLTDWHRDWRRRRRQRVIIIQGGSKK